MRSNEERVAAVKQRVSQIERQKSQRRDLVSVLFSVATCLVVIIAASLAMPHITARFVGTDYVGYETAASIFSENAAIGYIIIGLLAFTLGVCVTVLCYRLKIFQKKEKETGEGDGRVH